MCHQTFSAKQIFSSLPCDYWLSDTYLPRCSSTECRVRTPRQPAANELKMDVVPWLCQQMTWYSESLWCWVTPDGAVKSGHVQESANFRQISMSLKQYNICSCTYGRRVFLFAGTAVWNSLPDFIWDPTISADCFRRLLKTYLFAWY